MLKYQKKSLILCGKLLRDNKYIDIIDYFYIIFNIVTIFFHCPLYHVWLKKMLVKEFLWVV